MPNQTKEATKLVQRLRKSKSPLIQTLLWLPGAWKPFLCCLHRPEKETRPVTVRHPNGSNPGVTYYIIRLKFPNYGLSSLETFVAAGCAFAQKRGYVPVVDLKNYPTMYHEPGEVGQVNVWERYYEQPAGVSLAEAEAGCRIVYNDYCGWRQNLLHYWYFVNKANARLIRSVYQKYIRVNAGAKALIDASFAALNVGGEKLLGAVVRGTDYVMLKPEMHSIPPATQRMIDEVRKAADAHGCTRIFLATEDLDVLDAFRSAFGERLVCDDVLRFHAEKDLHIAQYAASRENDRYLRGLEYLTTLEHLARCDCLVGMGCSAFNYASLRRPEREYVARIDAGTY